MRPGANGMCIAALLGVACSAPQPRSNPSPPVLHEATWRDAYDLDGDGKNDRIVSEFTGGGHCCYRIGAVLSSTGTSVVFPFDMDGGYPRGLDLSQPDQFTIRTRNRGLPEIVYQIATYNGEPQPLDPDGTKHWDIRSHRIVLCFAGGNPQAHDEAPDLPLCKR